MKSNCMDTYNPWERHKTKTQIHFIFFWLSAYQNMLHVIIACILSRHHMSTSSHDNVAPPWGKNTRSTWGHIVDGSAFTLDLMSGNTSGGIQRSFIYRYAITFINVCLVKWLPHFNLILPLANYLHSVRAMFNGQAEEERKKAVLNS